MAHLHIKHVVQFANLLYNLLHASVVLDHQPHAAGITVGFRGDKHTLKVVGAASKEAAHVRKHTGMIVDKCKVVSAFVMEPFMR